MLHLWKSRVERVTIPRTFARRLSVVPIEGTVASQREADQVPLGAGGVQRTESDGSLGHFFRPRMTVTAKLELVLNWGSPLLTSLERVISYHLKVGI